MNLSMATSEQKNISTCRQSIFSSNFSVCYSLPYHFIACSFGINMFFGLPANFFILWLSVKEMIRGQSTENFIFNTALVEVIFNFSFVFVIRQYFFECTDCVLPTILLGMVLLVGRPVFQSCICVERYIGVLHPLIFLKLKPMKYRIACSAVGWILIISSSLIITMNVNQLFNFLLPPYLAFFTIKLYTCLMVLKALVHPGPGDDVKQRDGVNRDKIKAFRIIQIVLVSSVFLYIPIIVSLLLYHATDYPTFLLSWSYSLCLGVMTGFVQPFLYLRRVGKIRFCHDT